VSLRAVPLFAPLLTAQLPGALRTHQRKDEPAKVEITLLLLSLRCQPTLTLKLNAAGLRPELARIERMAWVKSARNLKSGNGHDRPLSAWNERVIAASSEVILLGLIVQ
jgi:hypothetical protein